MSTLTHTESTNTFPAADGWRPEIQCLSGVASKSGVGDSIIEIAVAFEDARQRAEYWLRRWTQERHNPRFLIRYVRSLRACDRLTNQLVTP